MTFKPLLASPVEFDKLDFTNLWVSAKLDGIRAIVINSVVVSRKLLPIPNKYVQHLFGRPEFEGFDGELIVGSPCSPTVYNDTFRGTMKVSGEADVKLFAFDHIADPNEDYYWRLDTLKEAARGKDNVKVLDQYGCDSLEQLLDLEAYYLNQGYEGVMLRAIQGPNSRYKFGRSTANQGTLLKLKRMLSDEATVVDVEEEMFNGNEAVTDELGRTKRSSHQGGKVGKGSLGALVCETASGVRFNIGTGFTAEQRQELWRVSPVGKLVTYNHFPIGAKDAPRFPSFKGFRSKIDV